MAITYVAQANDDTGVSTTATVDVPTGTQDGDVLVAVFGNGQDDGTTVASTGWTLIDAVENGVGSANTLAMLYKVASGEAGTYDFTYSGSGSNQTSCIVAAFRGVDNASPLDVTYSQVSHYNKQTNSNSPDPNSITTVTNGAFVIVGSFWQAASTTAITPSSGYTEVAEIISNSRFCHMQYKEVSTAGAENPGTITAVNGAGTEDPATMVIALRPATDTNPDFGGAGRGIMRGVGRGIG